MKTLWRSSEPAWVAECLSRWPGLSIVFERRWVREQSSFPPEKRSELYHWFEAPGSTNGDAFCTCLETAIQATVGQAGMSERISRLRSEPVGFWSSLCEMFFVANLRLTGIPATLHRNTPDCTAPTTAGVVGIELTARFKSLPFDELVEEVALTWSGPGRLRLLCPDETAGFLPRERDALVARLASLDVSLLEPPPVEDEDRLEDGYLYKNTYLEPGDLAVPTADIIPLDRLEVFVDPSADGPPYVASDSGARWGYKDPWPVIVDAAEEKAAKLQPPAPAIIGVEGVHMHTSTNIWMDLAEEGHVRLPLSLPGHIAGVLVYSQGATSLAPAKSLFVWNPGFSGPRAPIQEILSALRAPEVTAQPPELPPAYRP